MGKRTTFTPRKGVNPALLELQARQRDSVLIGSSSKANLLLTLMVLHDKFGFGSKRLTRFLGEYREMLNAYNEGYIEKVADFENVLWEECGIRIGIK